MISKEKKRYLLLAYEQQSAALFDSFFKYSCLNNIVNYHHEVDHYNWEQTEYLLVTLSSFWGFVILFFANVSVPMP